MKKRIIQKVAQKIANVIVSQFESTKDLRMQRILFDQAAVLNAYCIVFHNIYLD